MRTRFVATGALFAAALLPRAARAQDNSATVQAMFDEGKKLEASGNYAAACPKFLASYNLEHRVGTLVNLAYCYEENGQLASAWARFVEAKTLAMRAGQTERADFATQHAAALEPRLSKLVIVVSTPVAGLRITRDGTPVDPAEYGVAVPADEGAHVVEASAPGKQPWSDTVKVNGNATTASVNVPTLADLPVEPSPAPSPLTAAPATAPPANHTTWTGRRIVGAAVAGVGLVSLGVGTAFGVMAISKKNESDPNCNLGGNPNDCNQNGMGPRADSVTDANVSTILFAAGGALAVGGVVLWLTAPSLEAPGASVSFDGRLLRLSGSF